MENKKEYLVILFCDAHSFGKAGREAGDRLGDFMQAFYEQVGDAIVSQGGRIIKYIGDAMLATFPAGSEAAAVQAGIDMRDAYAKVVRSFALKTETDLEIGINAGDVFTGTFGHPSYQTYDIFGNAVNEAAVIMHHRGVAVLEAVYEACKDTFTFVQLPDQTVKWMPESLKAWEIA